MGARTAEAKDGGPDALMAALESERRCTSELLHDHMGPLLTFARMEIAGIRACDDKSLQARQNALDRLDECLRSIRQLARALHPAMLEDLGLAAALEALVEDVRGCAPCPIRFTCPSDLPRLGRELELTLYRAVQEALTNALRHAGARTIEVRISMEGPRLGASVEDDGSGFDPEPARPASLGLACTRERVLRAGGEWTLATTPGRGTRIAIRLPEDPARHAPPAGDAPPSPAPSQTTKSCSSV